MPRSLPPPAGSPACAANEGSISISFAAKIGRWVWSGDCSWRIDLRLELSGVLHRSQPPPRMRGQSNPKRPTCLFIGGEPRKHEPERSIGGRDLRGPSLNALRSFDQRQQTMPAWPRGSPEARPVWPIIAHLVQRCSLRNNAAVGEIGRRMAEWLTLAEAIAAHVHDGDSVAMEGFTHLIPFAAGHEIIRQGRRNLSLIRMTPDLIYDQLIGAGCAAKLTFSWGGNPGVGSLHRFRDAVENGWPGPLEIEERSHSDHGQCVCCGRGELAVRRSARLRGIGSSQRSMTESAALRVPSRERCSRPRRRCGRM